MQIVEPRKIFGVVLSSLLLSYYLCCMFCFKICVIPFFLNNNWYQSPRLGQIIFHTNLGFLKVNDFVIEMGSKKDSHKNEKYDRTNFSF